jgi:ATP-dependent DNA helicase RecG
MKTDQKESIMQQFKNAKLNILVSTTVIEVGVNVPNATLMVIEDADRLGLAQLHQLRGRVGRGQDQSYCALLFKAPLSDAGKQRLGIMRETTDGFIIAEKDLQIRGPGEYMGTRQTGQLQFKITNLETDEALIESCSKYKTTMMKQSQTTRNALIERWIVSSDELINA